MAKEIFNTDLEIQGKITISNVPNNSGAFLTLSGTDGKTISTRTNAETISDLNLSGLYALTDGSNAFGTWANIVAGNSNALGGYPYVDGFDPTNTQYFVVRDTAGQFRPATLSQATETIRVNASGVWPISITGYADRLLTSPTGTSKFHWEAADGNPTFLWGSNDIADSYVFTPQQLTVGNSLSLGYYPYTDVLVNDSNVGNFLVRRANNADWVLATPATIANVVKGNASGLWPINITGYANNAVSWLPTPVSDFNEPTGFKLLQSYSTTTNSPTGTWQQGIQFSTNNDSNYVNQLVFDIYGNLYTRSKYAGTWNGWSIIPFDENVLHKTGNETKTGSLTVTGNLDINSGYINSRYKQFRSNYIAIPSGENKWVKLFTTSSDNNISAKIEGNMTSTNSVNGFTIDIRGGYYDNTYGPGKPFIEVTNGTYNERLLEVMVLKEPSQKLGIYVLIRSIDNPVSLYWNIDALDSEFEVNNSLITPSNTTGSFVLPTSTFVKANNFGYTQLRDGAVGVGNSNPISTFQVRVGNDNNLGILQAIGGRVAISSYNDIGNTNGGLDLYGSEITHRIQGAGTIMETLQTSVNFYRPVNIYNQYLRVTNGSNPALQVQSINGGGFPLIQLIDNPRTSGAVDWNIENGRSVAGRLGFYSSTSADAIYMDQNGTVGAQGFSPTNGDGINWRGLSSKVAVAASNGVLLFYSNIDNGDAMRIIPNNNVGIGYVSPAYKLDVNGGLRVGSGTVNAGATSVVIKNDAVNGKQWALSSGIGGVVEDSFVIVNATNGVNALTITPTGNVGIGATIASERLVVGGNAIVTGNISAADAVSSSHVITLNQFNGAIGAANGIAPLNEDKVLPPNFLPRLGAVNDTYSGSGDYNQLNNDYPSAFVGFRVYCRLNNTVAEKINTSEWVIISAIGYIDPTG